MQAKKITISDYKSIDNLEFTFEKYGNSFTKIFVGLNEAGKSNILEAISLLRINSYTDSQMFDFEKTCNRSSKEGAVDIIEINMHMSPPSSDKIITSISGNMTIPENILKQIKIKDVIKQVYLVDVEDKFDVRWYMEIENIKLDGAYIKENQHIGSNPITNKPITFSKYDIKNLTDIPDNQKNAYKELTSEELKEFMKKELIPLFIKEQPSISLWKPEPSYILSRPIGLNDLKKNRNLSIPLTNLFVLCDMYDLESELLKLTDSSKTRQLSKKLSKKVTDLVNSIWDDHPVKLEINIEYPGLQCSLHIIDKGNEDFVYNPQERSQGLQQFLSLIMSLSTKKEKSDDKLNILLIDEPEAHLHPSGVRRMRKEIVKLGKNNIIFVSTHSNFMIDTKQMDRHFLVTKSKEGITNVKQVNEDKDIYDDEILRDGFGLDFFKDFFDSKYLLVEGLSDEVILVKAIRKLSPDVKFSTMNGGGSKIINVARFLNSKGMSTLAIMDDDTEGRGYKENIVNIKGVFNAKNVKTLYDLSSIAEQVTIEDTLKPDYVISKVNDVLKDHIKDFSGISDIDADKPVMEQVKVYMLKNEIDKKLASQLIDEMKVKISDDLEINNFEKNHPHLHNIALKLVELINDL